MFLDIGFVNMQIKIQYIMKWTWNRETKHKIPNYTYVFCELTNIILRSIVGHNSAGRIDTEKFIRRWEVPARITWLPCRWWCWISVNLLSIQMELSLNNFTSQALSSSSVAMARGEIIRLVINKSLTAAKFKWWNFHCKMKVLKFVELILYLWTLQFLYIVIMHTKTAFL